MSWEVDSELLVKVHELIPLGSHILELGSGDGSTPKLSRHFQVTAVEENEEWVGKYKDVTYIHAPLKEHKPVKKFDGFKNIWYDARVLEVKLPKDYDLILVDGPSSVGGRSGFFKYINLFRMDVPIIFDDLQRTREWKTVYHIMSRLKRPVSIYPTQSGKAFAIMMP